MMDATAGRIAGHSLQNLLHSLVLVAAMLGLMALIGWLLAGPAGVAWLMLLGGLMLVLSPRVTPQLVMRLYRARPLRPDQAPGLSAVVQELARRAGLPRPPQLHWIPSAICNAIAVGDRADSSIAVTDRILRTMTPRELTGILAHEISHIRSRDLEVMGLADVVSRITRMMSWIGQLLLFVNLPLILLGQVAVPWLLVLLLIVAPTLSALLQLALSRTREFDADLGAVRLTGDPRGLASALAKLERTRGGLLTRILLPDRGLPEPSVLRTHPVTEERIQRLLDLANETPETPRPAVSGLLDASRMPPPHTTAARWHASGLWY